MADAPRPFSDCSKVVLNCGNIASWNKIKKKVLLSSTQELSSALENTLISSQGVSSQVSTTSMANETCVLRNAGLSQIVTPEERANLTITLKVFLTEWDKNCVTQAIDTSLNELGLSSVDTVILAFPPCASDDLTLERIKHVWQAMEEAALEGRMRFLGTSDLNKEKLKGLFEWANVKPHINQMNLAHCCTIPEDLKIYAKEVNIRLFTHNDEKCILPVDELQQTLVSALKVSDMSSWQCRWVTRYHAIVNLRGIVSHKGYFLELEKSY